LNKVAHQNLNDSSVSAAAKKKEQRCNGGMCQAENIVKY